MDSPIGSQDLPSSVESGMIPCANSHSTMPGVRCHVRLSITKSRRRRGSALGSVIRVVSPSCHRSHCRRFSSEDRGPSGSGSAARMGTNASGTQGCSTALVPLRVPFTRTAPVTGQQSVINVAVPLRIYSCTSGRAFVSICQLPPTEGIV
jgi:hypothetical protein